MPFDGTYIDDPYIKLFSRMRKILEHGWCQGYFVNKGAYCVLGALTVAGTIEFKKFDIAKTIEAHSFLIKFIGDNPRCDTIPKWNDDTIPKWNDAEGRTKKEVLDLCDRAIAARYEELRLMGLP